MHHHHLENTRKHPEPFEVVGPASFIAASLGWSILKTDFEEALTRQLVSGRDIGVFVGIAIQTGVLFNWSSDTSNEGEPVYTVKFWPVNRAAPQRVDPLSSPDPWVKVGTTTIDGLISLVVERIGGDANDLMGWLTPRLIGGQMLVGHEFGATQDGMVIIRCDIVRRLSECCEYCDRDHLTPNQRERASECAACSASIAAKMEQRPDVKSIAEKHGLRYREQACPECGPHGNAGRVLGADIWYPCTLCAGGYPGDEHEVHRECEGRDERGMSCAARDGGPEEVEAQRARDQGAAAARAARGLRGAREVAALRSSLTEATVDNLRRYEALMADFKAVITIPSMPPGGYPTHDEYANYLSAHLATNLGTVDYDDPSISRAARMIDECLAEKR